jgi:hypothetical protein
LLLLGYFTANLDRWDPKVTNGFAAEREVILVDYPGDCTARSGQRRRLAAQAKDDVSRV